jgi:hypothetical protein
MRVELTPSFNRMALYGHSLGQRGNRVLFVLPRQQLGGGGPERCRINSTKVASAPTISRR